MNMAVTSRQGFSLVELSIVMIIVGYLLQLGIGVGSNYLEIKRYEETIEKLDLIEKALHNYVKLTGKLPCPAPGGASYLSTNFGIGEPIQRVISNVTESRCAGIQESPIDTFGFGGHTVGKISRGVVPVHDLGLSNDVLYDGWGRRITYLVNSDFTSVSGFSGGNRGITSIFLVDPAAGGISSALNPTGPGHKLVTDDAVMTLISHGKSGHGAWPRAGGSSLLDTVSGYALRRQLSLFNGYFRIYMSPKHYLTQGDESTVFDDIMRFKSAWNFEIPLSPAEIANIDQTHEANSMAFDATAVAQPPPPAASGSSSSPRIFSIGHSYKGNQLNTARGYVRSYHTDPLLRRNGIVYVFPTHRFLFGSYPGATYTSGSYVNANSQAVVNTHDELYDALLNGLRSVTSHNIYDSSLGYDEDAFIQKVYCKLFINPNVFETALCSENLNDVCGLTQAQSPSNVLGGHNQYFECVRFFPYYNFIYRVNRYATDSTAYNSQYNISGVLNNVVCLGNVAFSNSAPAIPRGTCP